MTTLESLNQNILVLKELIDSIKTNRPADKSILNKYQGFGNIREILYDPEDSSLWSNKKGIRESIIELHELLNQIYGSDSKEALLNSIKSSSLTSFYTPEPIVNAIGIQLSNIFQSNKTNYTLLEPSSGKGDFIKPFINDQYLQKGTAIEKDQLTALIHTKLFENTKINTISSGFEQYSNSTYEINNNYNIVISNIPFGNYKIHDDQYAKKLKSSAENQSQNQIHSYFFAKGIDKLKKDGYLVYITSSSIADSPKNDYLRRHLLLKSELISLTRLPNTTFDDTKVVTDVYILKKRQNSLKSLNDLTPSEIKFLKSEKITLKNQGEIIEQSINAHFVTDGQLNDKVIGSKEYGFFHDRPTITISSDKSINEIADALSTIINKDLQRELVKIKSPEEIAKPTNTKEKQTQLDIFGQLSLFDDPIEIRKNPKPVFPELSPIILKQELIDNNLLTEGNLFVHNELVGKIEFTAEGPTLVPLKNTYDFEKVKLAALVLINYKLLITTENTTNDPQLTAEYRNNLNKYYDQFVQKYAPFNMKVNRDIVELDVEGFKLKGIENYNQKLSVFEKSDIFKNTKRVLQTESINLKDAVLITLNQHNKIDINNISILTKLPHSQIIKEGLAKEYFYLSPKTNKHFDIKGEYKILSPDNANYELVTKDELMSGPVRFKLFELDAHNEKWFTKNDQEILLKTQSLLESVVLNEISIIDIQPKLGESWIPPHHFKDFAIDLFKADISITRNSSNSSYIVTTKYNSYELNRSFAVKCRNGQTLTGDKLLNDALHGQTPIIKYTIKYSDQTTQTFIDREAMSEAAMKIEQIHQKWNDYLLDKPDINTQLSNIYNNTQNIDVERVFDGSHLNFEGLQHFTPYIHQKNGVHQIVTQNGCLIDHIVGAGKTLLFCSAAMELKRLGVANKVCITALKANTREIYNDFKKAYPNAKILCPTESDFTPKKRQELFQKMQNNNWDAIILTHEQFQAIPQSREIQTKVLNQEIANLSLDLDEAKLHGLKLDKRVIKGLQTRIENKTARIQSLAASIQNDPYMLTFDKMGIDHLMVDESHEFKNLEFTTRHNRVAGLGSPEGSKRALNMLFAVRTLQEIHKGDKGVTFCSGTPISNSLIELYLLKKYLVPTELEQRNMSNFDSWARSYAELSRDFEISITNDIKPKERFRSFQKVPELARFYRSFTNVANDNNINLDKPEIFTNFIEIPATQLQKEYSHELVNAIQNEDFSFFGKYLTENQMNAKMLVATTISTKMSLDMRILDNDLPITEGSKLLEVSKNISNIYNESTNYKGTQFVFCDTSTPTSQDAHNFNIYDGLKNELTNEYGIPQNEIAFIHDFPTAKKRTELFKNVNEGKIRIILGSTKKMGVGVNMQERCVAMHHIDIPWTPKDIEQRDGRGARQGNRAAKIYTDNKIKKFVYATTGTLDAYRYYLVDLKQKFINQIKSSNITVRTIDEGDMDQDGSMSPAAFIARLSGKEELLTKNKIDKEITELELKKKVLQNEYSTIKNRIASAIKNSPLVEKRMKDYQNDMKLRNDFFKIHDEKLSFTIDTLNGERISDPEMIYEYLGTKLQDYKGGETITIGNIGSFQIRLNGHSIEDDGIQSTFQTKSVRMSLFSTNTGIDYIYGVGVVNVESKGNLIRYSFDCIKNLERKIEDQQRQLNSYEKETEKDKIELTKINPNIFDEQIDSKKLKSAELGLIIEADTNKIQETLIVNQNIITLLESNKIGDIKELLNQFEDSMIKQINLEALINSPSIPEELKGQMKIDLSEFISKNSSEEKKENHDQNHERHLFFKNKVEEFEKFEKGFPEIVDHIQKQSKPTNFEINTIVNSKMEDNQKLTLLHLFNIEKPLELLVDYYKSLSENKIEDKEKLLNEIIKNRNMDIG